MATADPWIARLARFARGRPRRDDATPVPRERPPAVERVKREEPKVDEALERGLRDIRATDPGFDPSRFVGYAGMLFRAAHGAWMARDVASLSDRVTPEILEALQAQCRRLRGMRHVNHVAEIDIAAAVTEAWQEGGRDYVTAHIRGSMMDYTVDEATNTVVDGSTTTPRDVQQFWTFTRRAGLNFWTLSAIQTA